MKSISDTDAEQRFSAVLDAAQSEPIVICRENRDVAVILSSQEYDRLRSVNLAEFDRLRERISATAQARGLTEAKLAEILVNDE